MSANCAYLRDPLLDVGGFQEDITVPGGDDVGLSFRLARSGWKFGFAEDALVYHDFRSSVPNFITTFRNYGAGVHKATRTAPHPLNRSATEDSGGGYGYGSLDPSMTDPRELMRGAGLVYREARRNYGMRTAFAFTGLRLLQQISYNYGWFLGS